MSLSDISAGYTRDIYRTWATNVWRLRAYRRMQHNILRWRNASVAGAFDTWHVNQHQLRVLRVIAARFSHHGEQRGFEHCFCLWRQTTHQVKVARRRAARVLAGRVYRSLLVGMWACWRRLGAALARERQVLAQVCIAPSSRVGHDRGSGPGDRDARMHVLGLTATALRKC